MFIRYLDKILLLKCCVLLSLIIIVGFFSVIPFYLAMIVTVILSLGGGIYSIFALSLYTILKYLNPAIFHFPSEFGAVAWLVLILSAARNIVSMQSSAWKIITPLLIFTLITAVLSGVASSHPSVSFMKLLSFLIGVSTVIAACSLCTRKDIVYLQHWIAAIYFVVIIFSVISLIQPKWAYFVNGLGLQGVLNHPQSFGTMLAPVLAGLIAIIGFGRVKIISIHSVFALIILMLIIMSQTRTALVSVLLSIVTVFLIFLSNQQRFKAWGSITKISINALAIIALLGTVFMASSQVRTMASSFVYKRGSDNLEQAVSSRAGGYDSQWQNFKASPILGHGFGVYVGQHAAKDVVTFMGIPISAPVEKGFILTALLEETGIVGTALFFILVISISKRATLTHSLSWVAIFFTCLYVNIGEAVFFSVGGIGLFYWILIGLSAYEYKLNEPQQKIKQQTISR